MAFAGFPKLSFYARDWTRIAGFAFFVALAGVAFIGAAGCHREPALTAQQAEGKHLYAVRCAHCHEDNDLALKKVPPDCISSSGEQPSPAVRQPQTRKCGAWCWPGRV
jgi:mono/diheme cytochrome c family protein